MKRWAALTVLLYAATLLVLTIPLLLLAGLEWSWDGGSGPSWEISLAEAWEIYQEWGYWLWLGILVLAQALLLAPLGAVERRLTPRRPLLLPTITAAFLLGNVGLCGVFSLAFAFFGDGAFAPFVAASEIMSKGVSRIPALTGALTKMGLTANDELFGWLSAIGAVVIFWMVWGLIFYRYAKADAPDALIRRATRWLLRGSVLELLVAVPSHVLVRGRDDCCAPGGTFWGIVTGLSVMLLAFGPGVLFLFVERVRRKQARK